MVKNTQGGSGHKKFARKHNSGKVNNNNKLRVSTDECEIYGIVTKMLGNGMFYCHCIDNNLRLGHIRGKFTGRNKRDNIVEIGKWVLIGLREWDKSKDTQHCDLLEVYTDSDKHRLKESITNNWHILDNNDASKTVLGDTKTDDYVVFGTDKDFERERLIEEMKTNTIERITLNLDNEDEEIIDIDDI